MIQPPKGPRPLKIHLFHCANSLDINALRQRCAILTAVQLTAVSLPCSGKVELIYLLKAFETGADGVFLITCPVGRCRYLEGNLRARKRAAAVGALLAEIGLQDRPMQVLEYDPEGGPEQIARRIERLCANLRPPVFHPEPESDPNRILA